MEQRHPHSDAAYRVVINSDQTFGDEVTIPETHPTTGTSFTTAADAEAWIAATSDASPKAHRAALAGKKSARLGSRAIR